MNYPDNRNPRHMRALMHNTLDRYHRGEDSFPLGRLAVDASALPRKSQNVAVQVQQAWERIDEDSAYFVRAVVATVDTLKKSARAGKTGLVITAIGRNTVNVADIDVSEDPRVAVTEYTRQEFFETFEGRELGLNDGTSVTLRDGQMHGDIQGVVVRGSNESGAFGTTFGETLDLVRAASGGPVYLALTS